MCFSGKKRLPSEWCLCVGNEYKHAEDEQIASKGTHRKKKHKGSDCENQKFICSHAQQWKSHGDRTERLVEKGIRLVCKVLQLRDQKNSN